MSNLSETSILATVLRGRIAALTTREKTLGAKDLLSLIIGGTVIVGAIVASSVASRGSTGSGRWLRDLSRLSGPRTLSGLSGLARLTRGRGEGGRALSNLSQTAILAAVLRRRVAGLTTGSKPLGAEDLLALIVSGAVIGRGVVRGSVAEGRSRSNALSA